jgi:hypothetical protein
MCLQQCCSFSNFAVLKLWRFFPLFGFSSPNCTLKILQFSFFPATILNIRQKSNNFTRLDPILLMCYFGFGDRGEEKTDL